MSLEELRLDVPSAPLTREVEQLLAAGGKRIDAFYKGLDDRSHRGFIPSDYRRAYDVLHYLQHNSIADGPKFCEWGSGFGIVTCLAALLEMEASGIEQDTELCRASRGLARDFGLTPDIQQGSFIPEGFDYYTDGIAGSKQLIRTATKESWDYPFLSADISEFDLVYVYPYPAELELVHDLFEQAGGEGSILITYIEDTEFMVHRNMEPAPTF